jgi:hypothetical protein
MPRVIHFDIYSDDPQRAIEFYTEVFGWQLDKWDGPMDYWLATTGSEDEPGINGGLGKREQGMSFNTFLNTIGVPSVDEYAAKIEEKGGKLLAPKMAIPGVGYYMPCQDTEGNNFAIMEDDETAQ